MVSITTVAIGHNRTVNLWADFQHRIIYMAINE